MWPQQRSDRMYIVKRRTDSDWEALDMEARETEVVRILSRD